MFSPPESQSHYFDTDMRQSHKSVNFVRLRLHTRTKNLSCSLIIDTMRHYRTFRALGVT